MLLLLAGTGCHARPEVRAQAWLAAVTDRSRCETAAPEWFCRNLAQLGSVALTLGEATSADEVELRATWRVPGDDHDAQHAWRVRLAEDPARVVDLALPGSVAPLWALEPVRVTSSAAGTVIAGGDQPLPEAELREAVRAVAAARLGPLVAGWGGGLVVELPSTADVLARMTGSTRPTGMAALAWPWGRDAATAAVHVLISPDYRPTDARERRYLLVHEATHVATRAHTWGGPVWVREGVAEHVARTQVGDVGRTADVVRADVRARGLPTALPADALFADGTGLLSQAYAHAALAVDAMVTSRGAPAAWRAVDAWRRGEPGPFAPADVTPAYLAALRQLA